MPSLHGSGGGIRVYRGIQLPWLDLPYDPSDLEDRDCREFDAMNEATAFWLAAGGPEEDPHWLDPDQDGNPCEGMLMWIVMSADVTPKPTAEPPTPRLTALAKPTSGTTPTRTVEPATPTPTPAPTPTASPTATAVPVSETSATPTPTPTPTIPAVIRNEVYEDRAAELALAWLPDNAEAVGSMVAEAVMSSTAVEAVSPLARPEFRGLLEGEVEKELGKSLRVGIAEVDYHWDNRGDANVSVTLLVGGTVTIDAVPVEAVDLRVSIVVTVDPELEAAVMGQVDAFTATVTVR